MSKFEDFDLDLRQSNGSGSVDTTSTPSLGAICTLVSGIIIGSVVTGCSDKCITTNCSANCEGATAHNPRHSCATYTKNGAAQPYC